MSDRWTVDTRRLIVQSQLPKSRLLIGLPFLLLGAWFFAKYFLLSIVAYVRVGDWRGLAGNPFGWLVILAMSALFLVPGWLLVFTRRLLVLDQAAGTATELRDFRVWRQVQSHALGRQREIVWLHEPVKDSRSAACLEGVYLVGRDEKHLLLGMFDDEPAARALAEAAAAFTGLPWKVADRDAWNNR